MRIAFLSTMQVAFIRHGQSEHMIGADKLVMQPDVELDQADLTEKGIAQAQRLSLWTRQFFPEPIVISSPVLRCVQTANQGGLDVNQTESGFREWRLGQIATDKHIEVAGWTWRDVFHALSQAGLQREYYEQGGEGRIAFERRVYAALHRLLRDNIDNAERVLISTHGGVIRTILSLFLETNLYDKSAVIANAVPAVFNIEHSSSVDHHWRFSLEPLGLESFETTGRNGAYLSLLRSHANKSKNVRLIPELSL